MSAATNKELPIIIAKDYKVTSLNLSAQLLLGFGDDGLNSQAVNSLFETPIEFSAIEEQPSFQDNYLLQQGGKPIAVKLVVQDVVIDAERFQHILILDEQHKLIDTGKPELSLMSAMKNLLGMGSIGLWDWDITTDTLIWDKQMHHLYGIDKPKVSSASDALVNAIHPDDKEETEQAFELALKNVRPFNTMYRVCLPSGENRIVRSMANIVFDNKGKPTRALGISWDNNKAYRAERILKAIVHVQNKYLSGISQKALFEFILNELISLTESQMGFVGLVKTDKLGKRYLDFLATRGLSWNKKTKRLEAVSELDIGFIEHLNNLYDYSLNNNKTFTWYDDSHALKSPHERIKPNSLQSYLSIPICGVEGLMAIYGLGNRACAYDDNLVSELQPFNSAISSIISSNQNYKAIENLARTDQLTELYNRHYFESILEDVLESHKRENKKFALLIFDLDNFKATNDIYGHVMGDHVLRLFARRLRSVCFENEVLARLGGDEFIILVKNIDDHDSARAMANKLYSKSLEPYVIENKKIYCPTSIGIATFPEAGTTRNALIEHADFALYEAKRGDNKVQFYSHVMEKDYRDNTDYENELIRAIDEELFTFDYQPIVDLTNHEIVGIEALARWDSERFNDRNEPEEFIRKIESIGMAWRMNLLVVKNVLNQFKSSQFIKPIILSINISSFVDDFVQHFHELEALITENPLPQNVTIELDVKESVLKPESLDDLLAFKNAISHLHKNNISVAIDDFGIEHSSLHRLIQYNFRAIKIDKLFIQLLEDKHQKKYQAMIKAIIGLCRDLGIHVIAEGIETQIQEKYIKEYGCQYAQGFLYYKPIPFAELTRIGILD